MMTDCSGCASASGCSSAATPASTQTIQGSGAPAALPATAQLQRRRRWFQAVFFAVFLLAPALNLLRFDLTETQLWVLGFRWSLGIDAFLRGDATAVQTAWSIVWRGILPVLALVTAFLTVAYHFGRLYCGWLCPHFSLVETLNDLLHRATGKLSVWDKSPTPRPGRTADKRWWPVFLVACMVFGFVWAITLLTYLLPPTLVWGNLVHGTLTPNQARFLVVGTLVFTLEFTLARHLFCRYGCAVGLFQSLAWMANPKGMVVSFARERARECKTCEVMPPSRLRRLPTEGAHADLGAARQSAGARGSACDHACPMRLNPRNIKRMMFACVQCGQCLTACDTTQTAQGRTPTLEWKVGLDAVRETLRQRREEQR
ncbi:4Fe-4S binding protein [Acidovorax carolinensis]|uniref:4Fe-4S binding protein n=1 Tax=Acidovorax carolinensis TaxID=553814 RepID=A0A240U6E0_9BURK|nr:4Fe-4S binding protein [Acidovorax carolinensis]